jgi:high-affinity K+ transport system ATPase subunit B
MIKVIKAELKDGYKIFVEFNNGIKGIIDLKNTIENDHREIIRELLKMEIFKTVKINLNTLCWDNGVDFAPDYLYGQIKIGA